MQLTTILAVLFACLVLFASVDYTNSTDVKGKQPLSRPDPFIKAKDHPSVRHEKLSKTGRHQFAARAIVNSIKERRRRGH